MFLAQVLSQKVASVLFGVRTGSTSVPPGSVIERGQVREVVELQSPSSAEPTWTEPRRYTAASVGLRALLKTGTTSSGKHIVHTPLAGEILSNRFDRDLLIRSPAGRLHASSLGAENEEGGLHVWDAASARWHAHVTGNGLKIKERANDSQFYANGFPTAEVDETTVGAVEFSEIHEGSNPVPSARVFSVYGPEDVQLLSGKDLRVAAGVGYDLTLSGTSVLINGASVASAGDLADLVKTDGSRAMTGPLVPSATTVDLGAPATPFRKVYAKAVSGGDAGNLALGQQGESVTVAGNTVSLEGSVVNIGSPTGAINFLSSTQTNYQPTVSQISDPRIQLNVGGVSATGCGLEVMENGSAVATLTVESTGWQLSRTLTAGTYTLEVPFGAAAGSIVRTLLQDGSVLLKGNLLPDPAVSVRLGLASPATSAYAGVASRELVSPGDLNVYTSTTGSKINIGSSAVTSEINIGFGADVINLGSSSGRVNVYGRRTEIESVTVSNKILSLNDNGDAGSSGNSGIEFREAGLAVGFLGISGDRKDFVVRTPAYQGTLVLEPPESNSQDYVITQQARRGFTNPVSVPDPDTDDQALNKGYADGRYLNATEAANLYMRKDGTTAFTARVQGKSYTGSGAVGFLTTKYDVDALISEWGSTNASSLADYVKKDGSQAFTGAISGVEGAADANLTTRGAVATQLGSYVKKDGTVAFTAAVSGVEGALDANLATRGGVSTQVSTQLGSYVKKDGTVAFSAAVSGVEGTADANLATRGGVKTTLQNVNTALYIQCGKTTPRWSSNPSPLGTWSNVDITFSPAYKTGTAPYVFMTPNSGNNMSATFYTQSITETGFSIFPVGTPSTWSLISGYYTIHWMAVGTKV